MRTALPFFFPRTLLQQQRCSKARVGDYIWREAGAGGLGLELSEVFSIATVTKRGLYNPYTLGGSIIVGGVLASSHSEWVLDSLVPESMVGHMPAIYQALFAPGRLLYALAGARAADALDLNSPIRGDAVHGYGAQFLCGALVLQLLMLVLATRAARKLCKW